MTAPFSIDATAMKTVVSKAIMESISQEQRDVILEQAVAKLITPTKVNTGYRTEDGPSPLQEAFDRAVVQAANTAVRELIEERPEFQTKVRAAVADAIDKLIEGDYNLASKVGSAVGSAVTDWASEQRRGY